MSLWCLEKAIQHFLKVILLTFILMTNIENLAPQEITKWENQDSLVLSMCINYQAMTLKFGHYVITNQGKGSAALVQTIVFNISGSWIGLIKRVRKWSLYFEVMASFCQHFLISLPSFITKSSIFESASIVNHCGITVVFLKKVKEQTRPQRIFFSL